MDTEHFNTQNFCGKNLTKWKVAWYTWNFLLFMLIIKVRYFESLRSIKKLFISQDFPHNIWVLKFLGSTAPKLSQLYFSPTKSYILWLLKSVHWVQVHSTTKIYSEPRDTFKLHHHEIHGNFYDNKNNKTMLVVKPILG